MAEHEGGAGVNTWQIVVGLIAIAAIAIYTYLNGGVKQSLKKELPLRSSRPQTSQYAQ